MAGTSKILTVSYGTFSCTLEGFEDPFGAMRTIAEYFRDLAAEDRYFGAEPPTPDAEMLRELAQTEVRKRIEARATDDGVALRQVEEAPREGRAQRKARERAEMKAAAKARVMSETDVEAAPAPAAETESIAAKMLRIRAAVARSNAEREGFAEDQETATFALQPISAAFADVEDEEEEADDVPLPEAAADETAADEDVRADEDVTDEDVAETAAEPEVEILDPEPEPADMAEAAEPPRLVRARVVKMNKRDFDRAVQADGEIAEEESGASAADFIRRALAGDTALPVADDEAEAEDVIEAEADAAIEAVAEAPEANEPDEDAVASDEDIADLAALDGTTIEAVAEETWPEPEAETAEAPADEALADEAAFSEAEEAAVEEAEEAAFEEEAEETEAAAETSEVEEVAAEAPEEAVEAALEDQAFDDEVEDEASDDATEGLSEEDEEAAILAEAEAEYDAQNDEAALDSVSRILNRAPAEPVADDGEDSLLADADGEGADSLLGEVAADDAPDDEDEGDNLFEDDLDRTSELSPEDEAELMEELAEVEREVADAKRGRDGKSVLEAHRSAESSVTRILRETESQLDDTEASRRRATIAHLKAAVAATRADGREEGKDGDDEDMGRYRDDLDRVVRPRRPSDGRVVTTPRRLAPLMLVSEQRVDLPQGGDAQGDVRPRRITAGNLALVDDADEEAEIEIAEDNGEQMIADTTSFAEYAARFGATELGDLIEAAAAYAAYVEGRPSFTRPQLMKQIAGFGDSEHNREDCLRSFGTLLRQGKISKLKRGQFTIARTSRFRPESFGA